MAAGVDQGHLNAFWSGPGGDGQLPRLDDIGHRREKQVLEDKDKDKNLLFAKESIKNPFS
jgi:hypothetical protein